MGLGVKTTKVKAPFMRPHAGCLLSTWLMAVGAGHDHGAELCLAGFSAVKSLPSLPPCALGVEVLTYSLHIGGRMLT